MSISPPSSPSPSPPSIPVPISNPNPTNPPPPPPRKVPPPCWTPDETFALVHAYRDRWFSLRRRNLRSPDWDAVAEEVSRRCPGSSPPKSSVQCRHKIEKLRKRYRSEKQRSLAYPGRFSSSWDLFPLLDSMEIAVIGSSQDAEIADVSRFRVKALPDRSAVPQGIVLNKHGKREDVNSSPNLDYEGEFGVKVVDYQNLVTTAFGSKSYAKAHHFDPNSGAGYGVQIMGAPSSVPGGIRLRNQSKVNGNYSSNPHFDYSAGQDIETGCGFPVKSLGNRNLMPQGFRSKNYDRTDGNFDAKLNHSNYSDDYGNDKDGGFYPRIPSDRLVPSGFRSMNYSKVDGSSTSNVDSGMRSGSPSSRLGFGKNGNSGGKRKMDPVAEMVSSIKMLGEGFVRMEKMKMEMAREIEKMRMEAEMKRNEMIIKSQQQIVDVFVNALFEKKKKVKMEEPHS